MAIAWQTVHISEDATFRVPGELEFIKKMGSGAFGMVAAFKNTTTGQKVAVKKMTDVFTCLVDAKRNLREIKLLRSMKHNNIIRLVDVFVPGGRNFEDIYIVEELMETDLDRVIRSKQPLTDDHHQHFVYQVLSGVHYIHTANIVHRDLKPANVLVNKSCDVKICDFGLGRAGWGHLEDLTDYVVTRWWRAPEVVLLPSTYTPAVDIWSIGCILAELIGRRPIFMGHDHLDQISKIFQVVGTPSESDLSFLPPPPNPARAFVARLPIWPVQAWSTLFPQTSDNITQTLGAMLHVNPMHRIQAGDAMQLPWFQTTFNESDLSSGEKVNIDWTFDGVKTPTKHWLQSEIYGEFEAFHPLHAGDIEVHLSPPAVDATMAACTPSQQSWRKSVICRFSSAVTWMIQRTLGKMLVATSLHIHAN